jgi:hypothetical protein
VCRHPTDDMGRRRWMFINTNLNALLHWTVSND